MAEFRNILLIDDDTTVNFLNQKIIERAGFADNAKFCKSGEEGLATLKSNGSPDVLIVDINLQDMTGWDFLLEAKSILGSLPITVLLTSLVSHEDRKKLESSQEQLSLPSPQTPEELLSKIRDDYTVKNYLWTGDIYKYLHNHEMTDIKKEICLH